MSPIQTFEHLSISCLFLIVLHIVADPVMSSSYYWRSLPSYCTMWTRSLLQICDFTSSRPCAASHILQELCWGSCTW